MRIALGIEYDGRGFSGWETQRGAKTVQSSLEQALSIVADCRIKTVCAGRTDAGVHAYGQTVHFDTDVLRPLRAWVFGTNANLPPGISVTWGLHTEDHFHARFSARSRHYRYVIFNRPVRPALLRGLVTWVHRPLDPARMQAAANYLLGEHDFSSYRALACQAKNPVRTVHRLDITRRGEQIFLDGTANGFLHHMMRNIAGVLIQVGTAQRDPGWARELLELRDRTQGAATAPPDGLYLMRVAYPEHYRIPSPRPPESMVHGHS